MATVTERLEQVLQREAPAWGVRPTGPEVRRLGPFDFAVLWGDLSIGLLVIVTGALLPVLGMGLPAAIAAIVLGSMIGCALLALGGVAGAREGVPGMVLFRPVLGTRGSYLPSVLNIVQLLGWTAFELWAMALVADRVGRDVLGIGGYGLWLAIVAVVCTLLALGGPLVVVRRWMERFGAWVVAAVALWITIRLLAETDLGAAWSAPAAGGLAFMVGLDLVIVMPISWLPLVADYNRFARPGESSARGTFWGYLVGNVWFYALGALLVLGAGLSDPSPAGVATAIASLAGGAVVLVALLVGETDQAFANIYSTAVSAQNLAPRLPQRPAILAVGTGGAAIAAWIGADAAGALGNYELFLFGLGSVFVPLYGVLLADYFVLRNHDHAAGELFAPGGRYRFQGGFNVRAFVPWVLGFLVYQWAVPTGPDWWVSAATTFYDRWLQLPFPLFGSRLGASLPAFAVAFIAHLALRPRAVARATRTPPAGRATRS